MFIIINIIAFIITFIGALNWGLIGIFGFNLVESIFGGLNAGSIIIYILVLVSALWLLFDIFYERGKISFTERQANKSNHN